MKHDLWPIRLIQITLGAFSCACGFFSREKIYFHALLELHRACCSLCNAPAIFFDGFIEKSTLDLFLLTGLLFLVFGSDHDRELGEMVGCGRGSWSPRFVSRKCFDLNTGDRFMDLVLFSTQPLANRLRWLGLFVVGLLLVLVPVGFRNLSAGGEFKLTTSQFGANFFIGNNPRADGTYGSIRNIIRETQLEGADAKRLAERAEGRDLTAGEVSNYWFHQSLDYIRSRPGEWLGLLGEKWLLVWNAREIEDSNDFYIYREWSSLLKLLGWINHFGILAPLAALGLWLTRDRWQYLWPLYAMILALAASVAIFYVFGRYRYPLVPLLVLFAGAGVVEAVRLFRDRVWIRLVPALLILFAAGVIVNWPLQKFRVRVRRATTIWPTPTRSKAGSMKRSKPRCKRLRSSPTMAWRTITSVISMSAQATSNLPIVTSKRRSDCCRTMPRSTPTMANCSPSAAISKAECDTLKKRSRSIPRLAERISTSVLPWRSWGESTRQSPRSSKRCACRPTPPKPVIIWQRLCRPESLHRSRGLFLPIVAHST